MSAPLIEIEQAGAVRRLWLARPGARNAQSQQMLDDLDAAFTAASADEGTRVVLLGARGDHFSAGHDLKEAQAKRADFTVEERWAYEQARYLPDETEFSPDQLQQTRSALQKFSRATAVNR